MTKLQMRFLIMIVMNVLSMMHWIVGGIKGGNVMKHVNDFANEIDEIVDSLEFQTDPDSGF